MHDWMECVNVCVRIHSYCCVCLLFCATLIWFHVFNSVFFSLFFLLFVAGALFKWWSFWSRTARPFHCTLIYYSCLRFLFHFFECIYVSVYLYASVRVLHFLCVLYMCTINAFFHSQLVWKRDLQHCYYIFNVCATFNCYFYD